MKPVHFALFGLLLVGPTHAGQTECKHRIIYLPQTHMSVVGGKQEISDVEELARSQFKIAKYLEKNPKLPVFSEQIDTTMTSKGIPEEKFNEATKEYRDLFPNGIPATLDEMSADQKSKLGKSGGDLTQFMLRKIETLNKTVPNRQIQNKLFADMTAHFKKYPNQVVKFGSPTYKLIFDKRELLALDEINNYFKKNPEQRDVVLIYGSIHDFSRHPKSFPSECIVIPFDFQDDYKAKDLRHPPSESRPPATK